MMKIYTKAGDKGFTKLYSGETVSKNDPLVKAYGKIDTLVSFLGFSKSLLANKKKNSLFKSIIKDLEDLQITCFKIMTDLSGTNMKNIERVTEKDIQKIESQIDNIWNNIEPLRNFVIPGHDVYSSSLHIARSVCREIEPILIEASNKYPINPLVIKIINRISDLLFSIAVLVDLSVNKKLSITKNNRKVTEENESKRNSRKK
ncbi:MAG: cob(I)yrinic acid a,c-diamide adenosyltransferase [Candidatus Calescibacterium sp.]|nr:cob(I)yrinic acid a,c-diamide adenosyltransferase [Candidatus Calescibacterium sp.]MCX7971874.1 cob(I)yrinic acid a,c-diamide adenosyltransferase [bacterium]MDW8195027.1 cob(I)yrinic acid a,c-diamide adenosyltransferase [Candidatus Calescibacterium sp.]